MGSLGQTQKISEGILADDIYRLGNHFGHVTQMPGINICSPTHKIWL